MSDDLLVPFEPSTREAWAERVDADLKRPGAADRLTHVVSGITLPALLDRTTARSVAVPPRSTSWSWRPAIWCRDITRANLIMRDEIARGATGFRLRLESPTRRALDPDPADDRSPKLSVGIRVASADDMVRLLDGVDTRAIALDVDADVDAGVMFDHRREAESRRGTGRDAIRGHMGLDPLGSLATSGCILGPVDGVAAEIATRARWAIDHAPDLRVARASAGPYHDAGATEADEIAFTLATAVEYVRWMIDGGAAPADAIDRLDVACPLAADLFVQGAKVRALRALLHQAWRAYDVDADTPVHASTSWRMMSALAPELNLLRTTTATLAATIGGVTSLTILPHDMAVDTDDASAAPIVGEDGSTPRQLAGNIHAILDAESHVAAVDDPARGSWYVDTLTHDLARAAWETFREIERLGGMTAALIGDHVGARVREAHGARRRALATRELPVVGVSRYAVPDEAAATPSAEEAPSSPGNVPHVADLVTCPPLPAARDADAFERLREIAGDASPRIRVVALGPAKRHKPRVDFARHLFRAGGVHAEVVGEDADTDGAAVVFCGADEDLDGLEPRLRAAVKGGAPRLYVVAPAGHVDAETWRAAGAHACLHPASDVIAVVRDLFEALGIEGGDA